MKAIEMDPPIESTYEIIRFIRKSIDISNFQGYTRIQVPYRGYRRIPEEPSYYDPPARHRHKRHKR